MTNLLGFPLQPQTCHLILSAFMVSFYHHHRRLSSSKDPLFFLPEFSTFFFISAVKNIAESSDLLHPGRRRPELSL